MANTQEVQIILTLEVDITKSKEDIKAFFVNQSQEFPIISIEVKEEAEIYKTNE